MPSTQDGYGNGTAEADLSMLKQQSLMSSPSPKASVASGRTVNSTEVSKWQGLVADKQRIRFNEGPPITAGWEPETSGWGSCPQASWAGRHLSISALDRSQSSSNGHRVLRASERGLSMRSQRAGAGGLFRETRAPTSQGGLPDGGGLLIPAHTGSRKALQERTGRNPRARPASSTQASVNPGLQERKERARIRSKRTLRVLTRGPGFPGSPFSPNPGTPLKEQKESAVRGFK